MQGSYNVQKQRQALQAKEESSSAPAAAKAVAVVERPAAARAPTGKSLTALLQSRSEAMAPLSERELAVEAPAVPDIDSKDHGDPLAASVYVRDIFSFYKRIEGNFRPSPDYMSRQVCPLLPSLLSGIMLMWTHTATHAQLVQQQSSNGHASARMEVSRCHQC